MSEKVDAVVVGAGIGGLSAALRLAGAGAKVLVLEGHEQVGGKMRVQRAGPFAIDVGPTVLTMRSVFEQLWEQAGLDFHQEVPTVALDVLARHRWSDRSELDLFAQVDLSHRAIQAFAGSKEADGFIRFHRKAQQILEAVREPFMLAADNDIWSGLVSTGLSGLARLSKIQWHRSLWSMLGSYFSDSRLRQLFARYATYYGSDPFQAPGTLALIAGVEMDGVWRVKGGMMQLALATARAVEGLGGEILCGVRVQELITDDGGICGVRSQDGRTWSTRNVVYNGALSLLGQRICPAARQKEPDQRSLSAVTLAGLATCEGMELAYHNVYFSDDYRREFRDIFQKGQMPHTPTTYICAQDSGEGSNPQAPSRLFALLNAPALGDQKGGGLSVEAGLDAMNRVISPCGIKIEFQANTLTMTTPREFEARFAGTGGALYGPATHGARGAFSRPSGKTKVPGLFLAGGQVHPGAGVPMVTLGGSHCADRVIERLALTPPSQTGVTLGGISTSSATTKRMRSR